MTFFMFGLLSIPFHRSKPCRLFQPQTAVFLLPPVTGLLRDFDLLLSPTKCPVLASS
jgi:hypothetical protein